MVESTITLRQLQGVLAVKIPQFAKSSHNPLRDNRIRPKSIFPTRKWGYAKRIPDIPISMGGGIDLSSYMVLSLRARRLFSNFSLVHPVEPLTATFIRGGCFKLAVSIRARPRGQRASRGQVDGKHDSRVFGWSLDGREAGGYKQSEWY